MTKPVFEIFDDHFLIDNFSPRTSDLAAAEQETDALVRETEGSMLSNALCNAGALRQPISVKVLPDGCLLIKGGAAGLRRVSFEVTHDGVFMKEGDCHSRIVPQVYSETCKRVLKVVEKTTPDLAKALVI